eukprot:TRINITY_DN799_c0_g1_i3.p1 TRINITY_DN799_c0_g1~~TRINITY_DN799_c0_g1_i3.p1  ORF type:complete len:521 (-),score=45.32 TRINITY_DN799_c0_g1_i3:822-2384(-)
MAPVYTEEEVDALLKQVDVAVSKVKEYRHKVVKLRSAEANLLELYEKTRLMIHDFLKNPDREDLIKVFGGDCRRIAKLLIALDYDFSEMYAPDPRPSSLKKTVESLEAVLNDKGFCQAIREAKVSEETARERGETMFHESTITKANQLLASLGCDHAEMVPVGRLPPVAWNFASGESERLAEFTVCDPKLEQASIQEQNPSSAEPGFSPEAQPGQLVPGAVAGNPALPPSQGPGCEPAKPSVTLPAGEGSRVVQTEVAQPGQSTVAQPSGGGYGGKDVPLVPSPFLTDSTRADVPGSEGTLGQGGPCSAPAEAGQTLPLVHGVIQDLGETRTILTPIVSQEAQAYTLHSGLQSVPEGPVSHPSVASAPGGPVNHAPFLTQAFHPSVASALGGLVSHPSAASAPGGPVNLTQALRLLWEAPFFTQALRLLQEAPFLTQASRLLKRFRLEGQHCLSAEFLTSHRAVALLRQGHHSLRVFTLTPTLRFRNVPNLSGLMRRNQFRRSVTDQGPVYCCKMETLGV